MITVTITRMLNILSAYPVKTKQTILGFCRKRLIPCVFTNGKWFIDTGYVDKALSWRTNAIYIEDLIKNILSDEELNNHLWLADSSNLTRKISMYYQPDNEFSILFIGSFISPDDEEIVRSIINEERRIVLGRNNLLNMEEASEALGLSSYKMKKLIDDGLIEATRLNNNWFFDDNILNAYKERREGLISIYEIAKDISKKHDNSFDIENRTDRTRLNTHIRRSELEPHLLSWDEVSLHDDRRNALYIPKRYKTRLSQIVEDFISSYPVKSEPLMTLLDSSYFVDHPLTRDLIADFAISRNESSMIAICNAISNNLTKEIIKSSDNEIVSVLNEISEHKVQRYRKDYVHFIKFCKTHAKCDFDIELSLETPKKGSEAPTTIPYSSEQFIGLGQLCFKKESVEKYQLYEKAIVSPKLSYVLLFICFHYISAWRKGDIEKQIPLTDVPYSWDEINSIINSNLFDSIAISYSLTLENLINNGNILPGKTSKKQHNRFLVVDIPTSFRPVLGRVYLIYCKHCADGIKINKTIPYDCYYSLFGDEYYRLFGRFPFSNRRGNKAYLNSLSTIITEGHGISSYVMSYRVASYARGHVESNGQLSDTTSRYLMHHMDNMSIDEVLFRLHENGLCSFTVRYLLEIAYGDRFAQLGFREQSELVHQMGMTAYMAESVTSLINSGYIRSKVLLKSLFDGIQNKQTIRSKAQGILKNLCNQTSRTNISGVSCLIAATRASCPYRYSRSCVGCKYSIYELSFFSLLVETINKSFCEIEDAKTDGTRKLIQRKIDNEYLPAVTEILTVANEEYGFDVVMYAQKIMEIIKRRGLNDKNE